MPGRFQHFIVGVLVTVAFPLLPLGVEARYGGSVSVMSLYIAAIMYVSAISLAYEAVAIFYVGAIASIVLAIDYGFILAENGSVEPNGFLPAFLIIIFGITQTVKCYDLHINRMENFIYFPKVSN